MSPETSRGFPCPDFTEQTRAFVWKAISETGTRQLLAAQYGRMRGWTCSQKQAASKISQWLNPQDHHPLPADFLFLTAMVTGRLKELRALLHEAEEHAERFTHKEIQKVQAQQQGREVA